MLNMIKMDLYRMFRTKSLYIIWIIMAAAVIFSTSMSRLDIQSENEHQQTESGVQQEEPVNVGMSVSLPTQPGEKVTVFDQVFANLQSKFIALFMVIFTVIFSNADMNSGYIKNIGGQIRRRENLIFSRAIALFAYTVLSMIWYLILQIVMQQAYFGYLKWGNESDFLKYFLIQTALHYALVLICMAVSVILNSSVFSMVISVCLCMNLMSLLYGVGDRLIQKLGVDNFHLFEYTVTGKMTLLSMSPGSKACLAALCTAVAFGLIVTVLTGQIFKRRDI